MDETFPATSPTLLRAIAADPESPRWNDFARLYGPVVRRCLARTGAAGRPLGAADRDDLVQETFLALAGRLPDYRHAPDEKGRFRNYLAGILRFKAIDELRRRAREDGALAGAAERAAEDAAAEGELRAWREAAYEVALSQYLADPAVQTRTKEIFRRVALGGERPEDVAAAYGLTRNAVDQIRARATRSLRERAAALADEEAKE